MASDHPFSLAAQLLRQVFVVAAPISNADDLGAEQELPDVDVPTVSRRHSFNSLRLWFLCFDCGVLVSRAGLHLGLTVWGKTTPHGCREVVSALAR